jgi:RimJ/RimL family protein N-acetyltransferase
MIIRKALLKDTAKIYHLYKQVAKNEFGIARMEDEINEQYIQSIIHAAQSEGVMLVGVDEGSQSLIAEIHASKYGLKIFDHILTHLTIIVHPDYQGKGLGKKILQAFLHEVETNHAGIRRVELESRSSNQRSIGLYKQLGFVQEGTMKDKTRNKDGSFEDSILMAWTNPNFINTGAVATTASDPFSADLENDR